jgi:hypothetical protein
MSASAAKKGAHATAKWGIVSTIKAPAADVLRFAAYHLEQGAHRLYIYLDAPDPAAYGALKAHPKIRVTETDDSYWAKHGKRPAKHQPRQTINAADAYAKRAEIDWLIHIDCDEFIAAPQPLGEILAGLPSDCLCSRMRPVEVLAGPPNASGARPYKGYALPMPERRRITEALYPTFGRYLNGGFLSHVAGKLAYRTGLPDFHVKIHNCFQGETQNPGQQELPSVQLCHQHAGDWDTWFAHYKYRLQKGAYRAELKAPFDQGKGGLSMHALLQTIEEDGGTAGLRSFFDEVCTARPDLLNDLASHNLLSWHALDLDRTCAAHFPDQIHLLQNSE